MLESIYSTERTTTVPVYIVMNENVTHSVWTTMKVYGTEK